MGSVDLLCWTTLSPGDHPHSLWLGAGGTWGSQPGSHHPNPRKAPLSCPEPPRFNLTRQQGDEGGGREAMSPAIPHACLQPTSVPTPRRYVSQKPRPFQSSSARTSRPVYRPMDLSFLCASKPGIACPSFLLFKACCCYSAVTAFFVTPLWSFSGISGHRSG